MSTEPNTLWAYRNQESSLDLSVIDRWRDLTYLQAGNERQRRAYQAIQQLDVFTVLAPFDPILVSTVCLGIDIPTSDLDIICYAEAMDRFERTLHDAFSANQEFNIRRSGSNGSTRVVVSFQSNEFEFEIFGAPVRVENQAALHHLHQTWRLIQFGGDEFRQAVRTLKLSGWKTEPAIAHLLGLFGDPYKAVIELRNRSDKELQQLVIRSLQRLKDRS